jgi:hypothetical protein
VRRLVRLICALVAVAAPAGASAAAHAATVRYLGVTVHVPAGWPVFHLDRDTETCVRFNRHAVYLGTPGRVEACGAGQIGRSEAILVEPRDAAAGPAGPAAPVQLNSGRARVLASWNREPGTVARALRLSARALRAAERRAARRPVAAHALVRRALATAVGAPGAAYAGAGFDACSAPSLTTMRAWTASPYRAVGIYLGGANSACAQRNLTASWVTQVAALGWHLVPTYVGLQAPGNACGCSAISTNTTTAASQGAAAAADAVAEAQALGLGAGNPIYFDMEGYARTARATAAATTFLAAWTQKLHALGYLSGVYSSTGSGIADLVARAGTGYAEPDAVWFALWDGSAAVASSALPAADWSGAHRIHQYRGGFNASYGGVTLNIDADYLDAPTAAPAAGVATPAPATAGGTTATAAAAPYADGTFVEVPGTGQMFEIVGGAPVAVRFWGGGGIAPVTQVSADQLAALPAVPADGTLVEGIPSGRYWTFVHGQRVAAGAVTGATQVADDALAAWPLTPCVVPNLSRLTVTAARSALARAGCALGSVRRPRHVRRGHTLRVSSQSAPRAAQLAPLSRVGITLR